MRFAPFAKAGLVLVLAASFTACGGGGGGPASGGQNPGGPPPATVTVSGKITFDRIPFDATLGSGLNPNAPIESPARGVVVEAVAGTSVLATTVTTASGDYSLNVPSNTQMTIQAKAQMLKADAAPTWNFRVLNNTNSDALYVLETSPFSSGSANSTKNLRAASGWGGTSYTTTRAAAPFAILDTMYQAKDLIISASATAAFPALNIYWSATNKPTTDTFCIDDGDIGVTFYSNGGQDPSECDGQVPEGMYVLGDFAQGDTDEFDQHVLAHEFGHYVEDKFSRSDSIGGQHGEGNKLDLRVAFGEGWGNAFSGMVLNDPVYRDSYSGAGADFRINMEADDTFGGEGWYSESSVAEILWDAFDATNESGDSVSLGFAPIFAAINVGQRNTSALTSIFSFLEALNTVAPSSAAGITQLRSGEQISANDEFATNEMNSGGDPSVTVLPIYRPISLGVPQTVCVSAAFGVENKLGNAKFFRWDISQNVLATIRVDGVANGAGTPATDPDIYVHKQGQIVAAGTSDVQSEEVVAQQSYVSGTYVIELLDFDLASGLRCMTISISGAST
jgi:hypothetical protein